MAWSDIVQSRMHELNLIASWASQVRMGRVRDLCREAAAELKYELERVRSMESDHKAAIEEYGKWTCEKSSRTQS